MIEQLHPLVDRDAFTTARWRIVHHISKDDRKWVNLNHVGPFQHASETLVSNSIGIEVPIDLVQVGMVHLYSFFGTLIPHRKTLDLQCWVVG